jgi:predicted TIM-barrel fold metal-dependent hydrolase
MLQIHGDAAVIDAVFERQPGLTVLWAHLGTKPRPDAIAPVLARHPNLYVDTSVRDGRFVDEQGRLRLGWHDFFVNHADRVLVGVDTFWTRRWKRFDAVAAEIRSWLGQLPPDVAEKLGHTNATGLFSVRRGAERAP